LFPPFDHSYVYGANPPVALAVIDPNNTSHSVGFTNTTVNLSYVGISLIISLFALTTYCTINSEPLFICEIYTLSHSVATLFTVNLLITVVVTPTSEYIPDFTVNWARYILTLELVSAKIDE
jgi:hypothetical protein